MMNQIIWRPRLRRIGLALLSCGITFILFLLLSACWGIFPCGGNSIVWCDMEQQAVPLLMQLRQMAQRGEFSGLSQLNAGGMPFYAVFFFFLSNPGSLLILLTDLPADKLVTLLVILKLSLASGTAAFWFRGRIPALSAPMQVLLGVMYGCSGYGLFYYQNLMWLDIMILLPLLMVSIRRFLKKADPLPFVLLLSASVLLSFYLSYMIVLFVVLYMAVSVRTTVPAARQGIIARRFLLSCLCAAGLTAFVWLPCLIQVMHSARGVPVWNVLAASYLFDHLGDKICLLGCTCLGFAALPLLWQKQTPRISSRRRDRRIFLLLTAAVLLDPVNIMWHGGSYQAFPLRWGMIPVLLLLTLAGKQLAVQYDEAQTAAAVKHRRGLMIATGLCMAAAFGYGGWLFFCKRETLSSYLSTLWVSADHVRYVLILLLLLFAAYLFIITFRQNRLLSERAAVILIAVLFAGEFLFNHACYIGLAANPDTLYAQTVSLAGAVQPAEDTARLKMTKKYAHANMLGALGYPTLAHYTSLTRADFLYGMKRLGYSSYWMEVPSTGGTLLSDALWNVRYQFGAGLDFPDQSAVIWAEDPLVLAENSNMLPSALYAGQRAVELADLPGGSRISVQEQLAESLLGVSGLVKTYAPTELNHVTLTTNERGETVCKLDDPDQEGEIRYSLFIQEQQALYFDLYSQTGIEMDPPRNGAVAVRLNGRTLDEFYPEDNGNGFVSLGVQEQQYTVVSIRVLHDFTCESFGLFGLDTGLLAAAAEQAKGTELHYKNGVYTAECKTDSPQTLILSAAYDEGFSAEINGEPAPVFRVNSCQLAVEIPAGESRVVLRYHVPGLLTGLLLGGGTLLAAVLLYLLRRKIPKKMLRAGSRIAAPALQAAYVLLLLVIYIFPLVSWAAAMLVRLVTPKTGVL